MAHDLLVHNVYFALNNPSPPNRQKLMDACRKYLPGHDGIIYFACGILADELKREVNDRDFDVGLHIVFKDQVAHDEYQDSQAHHQFVDENKATWKKVRVFDSVCMQSSTP